MRSPVSSNVARTSVTLSASSKNLPVRRAAPSQPRRVLPPPSTLRPSLSLARRPFKLALSATNLLNAQYRLVERNFESDFRSQPAPTLVAVRHFSAGAPRQLMLTLEVLLGGGS